MIRLTTFCVLSWVAWITNATPVAAQAVDGVRAIGTIEPQELADVVAPVAGLRIKSLGPDAESATKIVDYGSHVKKNGLLVQFDDAENALLVQKAKAGVQRAIADYDHAKAQAELAEQQIKRVKRLESGAKATADDVDVANAGLDVSRARVRAQESAIEQARAELKLVELHLQACTVLSPIDGIVIARRANVGQAASIGQSLFLIASDPEKYQVWAAVDEASIAQIVKGQAVQIRIGTMPNKSFTGHVSQIRLNAQMIQNTVHYTVVVDPDEAKGLLPYQTADVLINTAPSK